MARNTEGIQERARRRNQYIVNRFRELSRKNPHFRIEYILSQVANEMFLSPVTITGIIKNFSDDKVPAETTISSRFKRRDVQQMSMQLR